jgi:hypothetical protein
MKLTEKSITSFLFCTHLHISVSFHYVPPFSAQLLNTSASLMIFFKKVIGSVPVLLEEDKIRSQYYTVLVLAQVTVKRIYFAKPFFWRTNIKVLEISS